MNARTRLVLNVLVLALHSVATADSPRDLIRQGAEHYKAGRYAEALEAYEKIGDEPDEALAAELLHDKAGANYKLGNLDEARELWVRAAGLRDEAFEAAARYNLGNCDYSAALQALDGQDANATMELLGRAIQQYRDALKLDPRLASARANLELAAQLKKQIEEQSEQQPQSQPSSQPSDESQQQQNQQSSSQPSSQPSEQDQQDQQNQQKDQSQQQNQQQQDQQQQDQQQQEEQASSQPSPESQPSEQPQEQQEQQQAGEQEEQELPPIEMTREQAERLLQQIRDAEQRRRAILKAREAAKQKPVEKDW